MLFPDIYTTTAVTRWGRSQAYLCRNGSHGYLGMSWRVCMFHGVVQFLLLQPHDTSNGDPAKTFGLVPPGLYQDICPPPFRGAGAQLFHGATVQWLGHEHYRSRLLFAGIHCAGVNCILRNLSSHISRSLQFKTFYLARAPWGRERSNKIRFSCLSRVSSLLPDPVDCDVWT